MSEDLKSFLDETKKQEGIGGGNGFIAQIKVEFGYKLYIAGMSNEESWLPYKARDEKSKQDAHDAAVANYVGVGVSEEEAKKKLRQSSAAIIIKNGTVLNRQVAWKGDQYHVTALWTDAYQQVVEPSLSGKITSTDQLGKWLWGWVKFIADPAGRTRAFTTKDETTGVEKTEIRPVLVAYIEEVFPTKVAAVQRATEIGQTNDDTDAEASESDNGKVLETPEGFTVEEWKLAVADIRKANAAGKSPFALSKDYGVEIRFIKEALA